MTVDSYVQKKQKVFKSKPDIMPSQQVKDENEPDDYQNQSGEAGEIVVLTGSSGCLGQQTLKLLISHDDRVAEIRCLDLVAPSESMKRSIQDELVKFELNRPQASVPCKRVKYIEGDIRDINIVEACLDGADCVIHCAAKVDFWTDPSEQNAEELESINVQGTENLLKACVRLGVAKFVHVSSFETFVSYHTIYYATESTIPDPKWLLFGPSAESKKEAENKVRQYSNNKLKQVKERRLSKVDKLNKIQTNPLDSLNAVIIRFTPIYGPEDKYFVTKILEITRFFNGQLKRFTNVWIRQQPIYVGNAAWSLIKAKQRMDVDESISGEDFHITDDTNIGDPFEFIKPFVECKGMRVSNSSLPAWPVWLMLILITFTRNTLRSLDIFGLFTTKKSRLDEAKERDEAKVQQQSRTSDCMDQTPIANNLGRTRWYHMITSQTFYFMCNSLFLNRTKASLRLDFEPLFTPEESIGLSIDWYKCC